jgi:hypothetical protein
MQSAKILKHENYLVGLKRKLLNEQKLKSKYKRELDRLNGKSPNNDPRATYHSMQLGRELIHYIGGTHHHLAPRTRAQILCKFLYDYAFLDGVLFKEVGIKIWNFYHDFVFPNFSVLKAMDEKGGCLN